MDNKIIAFLIVGVLVGAAAGIGIGYVAFKNNDNNSNTETTYWFYIDYGDAADATHVNTWVSAKATDAVSGFEKAMSDAGIAYSDDSYGYTGDIAGVAGDRSYSWMGWLWVGTEFDDYTFWGWQSGDFHDCIGNVFYCGYSTYTSSGMAILEPNYDYTNPTVPEWVGGNGPFV